MTIYEHPDYLKVSYNSSKNYVLFDWTDASIPFDDIKEAHTKAFEFEKEKGVSSVIADCSRMKYSFSSEITNWFATQMMPRLSGEANVKRIITVLNESALARLNASSWQKANDIELPNVNSLSEAEKLVV